MAGLKSVSRTFQSPTRVIKILVVILLILGTARIVRAGPGTENVKVEVLQKFFRANGRDSFSGDKSFMYGKSTANQVKIMPTNFSYCAWLHICSWLLAWQELKRLRDSSSRSFS